MVLVLASETPTTDLIRVLQQISETRSASGAIISEPKGDQAIDVAKQFLANLDQNTRAGTPLSTEDALVDEKKIMGISHQIKIVR